MNHYEILKLPITASSRDITKAYRELAKIYHPDKLHSSSLADEEVFKRLQTAYEVLSHPEKRRTYDESLSSCEGLPAYFSFNLNLFSSLVSLFKTCVREDDDDEQAQENSQQNHP